MAEKLNSKIWMLGLGSTTGIMYILCLLYGFIAPDPAFHHSLFEKTLLNFKWLTIDSLISGFLQVFVWGAIAGAVFANVYNWWAASKFAR